MSTNVAEGAKLCLDAPAPGHSYPSHRFPVAGWLWLGERQMAELQSLEAWAEGRLIGRTRHFRARADVSSNLNISPETKTAFEFFGSLGSESQAGTVELQMVARLSSGSAPLGGRQVCIVPSGAATLPYGLLLDPATQWVWRRENIYGSGPSTATCDPECLAEVRKFIDHSTPRVLDVGCGLGAFAEPFRTAGFDWFGVEVKESDCAELARRGVPHQQIAAGQALPFADAEFDAAICLEVLEHVPEPTPFLSEIARVTKKRAVFSVPNAELIPLMSPHLVAPWHILEGDHKNFFNRFNLRALLESAFAWVEVFDYRMHALGPLSGQQWPFHLLAVADKTAPHAD